MNTDNMNLAYLVGKVMDEIINFQILLVIIRPFHASTNVKMLECLCILKILDVKDPCIAAISLSGLVLTSSCIYGYLNQSINCFLGYMKL